MFLTKTFTKTIKRTDNNLQQCVKLKKKQKKQSQLLFMCRLTAYTSLRSVVGSLVSCVQAQYMGLNRLFARQKQFNYKNIGYDI